MTSLQFTPVHALCGGALLGIASIAKLALTGRVLGVQRVLQAAAHRRRPRLGRGVRRRLAVCRRDAHRHLGGRRRDASRAHGPARAGGARGLPRRRRQQPRQRVHVWTRHLRQRAPLAALDGVHVRVYALRVRRGDARGDQCGAGHRGGERVTGVAYPRRLPWRTGRALAAAAVAAFAALGFLASGSRGSSTARTRGRGSSGKTGNAGLDPILVSESDSVGATTNAQHVQQRLPSARQKKLDVVSDFVIGAIFGAGLVVSGMIHPAKVSRLPLGDVRGRTRAWRW